MSTTKLGKHGIVDFHAPRHLFKYQPINDTSIENLIKQRLWASSPEVFNDPFEFQYSVKGTNPYSDELDSLFDRLPEFKVVCLTTDPYNILMWSHYTEQHKGMCLGFYNFTLSYRINYSDDFPRVDFTTREPNQRELELNSIFHTKAKKWEYEVERRMMMFPGYPNAMKYPGELFTIIFGARASKSDIDKVRSAITNEDTLFYQCYIAPGNFVFGLNKL